MTSIVTQLKVDGVHFYEKAPPAVEHLKSPHRHVFHVRIEIEVFHADRDIEIIMLKHLVQNYFDETYPKLNHQSRTYDFADRSCETIAEDLLYFLKGYYREDVDMFGTARKMSIEILEDGENGAIVRETV